MPVALDVAGKLSGALRQVNELVNPKPEGALLNLPACLDSRLNKPVGSQSAQDLRFQGSGLQV